MSTTAFDDQYRTDEYSEIVDTAPLPHQQIASSLSENVIIEFQKGMGKMQNTAAEITAYFASLK